MREGKQAVLEGKQARNQQSQITFCKNERNKNKPKNHQMERICMQTRSKQTARI